MSRRLALLLSTVGAIVFSSPAFADPECFGAACRMTPQALMPRVDDPPRLTNEVTAMDATGNLVDVMPPPIASETPARSADMLVEPVNTSPAPAMANSTSTTITASPSFGASPASATADEVIAAPASSPPRPTSTAATARWVGTPASDRDPPVMVTPTPIRPAPQMVVDPVTVTAAPPRYAPEASPRPVVTQVRTERPAATRQPVRASRPQPVRVAPEVVEQEPEAPSQAQAQYAPQPQRSATREAPRGRAPAQVARVQEFEDAPPPPRQVISVAPQVHVEGSVVVVSHPNAYDPAWKRCQTDSRSHRRAVECGPASYYPYGAQGYRPYGTYRAYATAPGYISVAPDPRIINIARGD